MLHICWLLLVNKFQGCPCATYIAGILGLWSREWVDSLVQELFFGDELPGMCTSPSPFVVSLWVNFYVRFRPRKLDELNRCSDSMSVPWFSIVISVTYHVD